MSSDSMISAITGSSRNDIELEAFGVEFFDRAEPTLALAHRANFMRAAD
jgi:hypothetical protein